MIGDGRGDLAEGARSRLRDCRERAFREDLRPLRDSFNTP